MNTLYVFGIGGTGERVLRSLVMLVAGGLDIKCNVIQPVFIDSDSQSKALERAKILIDKYRKVRQLVATSDDYFQRSNIMPQMFRPEIKEAILLNISGSQVESLKKMVEYANMPDNMKAEFDMLYSKKSQEMNLSWGFVGNPSIGSIVLNQMLETESFISLRNSITSNDGVFIVSSIFGGTGASGFPLLVNSLKENREGNIPMGALSVFPYFKLTSDEDHSDTAKALSGYDVKPEDFSIKTKAALTYYDKHLKGLSSMYYLGSNSIDNRCEYKKCLGGSEQDNPACAIELWGAKAIAHFTHEVLDVEQEDLTNTKYYEYFVDKGDGQQFFQLDTIDPEVDFRKIFVRLEFLELLWKHFIPGYLSTSGNQWATSTQMTTSRYDTLMGSVLNGFLSDFQGWKQELKCDANNFFKFRFFNDEETYDVVKEERNITTRFFPSIAQRCSRFGFMETTVDPNFAKLMNDPAVEHHKDGLTNDRIRQQFAFFTSLYTIEHIVSDTDKNKKINLEFNTRD